MASQISNTVTINIKIQMVMICGLVNIFCCKLLVLLKVVAIERNIAVRITAGPPKTKKPGVNKHAPVAP